MTTNPNSRWIGCFLMTSVLLAVSGISSAQQVITGAGKDGSTYEIAMPAQWNGQLVLYAHGIDDPEEPLVVPSQDSDFGPFRDGIVARGYAVASSSWSSTGYAVKDGAQRTRELSGIFRAQFGKPRRTFLAGKSLGALVVLKLAERRAERYDGVLTMCGPLAGGSFNIGYLADERAIFDFFFPGTLPGDTFHTPLLAFNPPPTPSPAFLAVYAALLNGFSGPDYKTLQFAGAARLQAGNASELIQAALEGIGYTVRFDTDLLNRTHGEIPYDNSTVVYSGSFIDEALNAGIERFVSQPGAVNFLRRNYEPTGDLDIPLLSLHTTRDPIAPLANEEIYAGRVAKHGDSDFLVQQTVDRFDHCSFQLQEKLNAFDGLVSWVNHPRQKPRNGDVTLPAQ